MINHTQKNRIKGIVEEIKTLHDVDVTLREGPDCVVSFRTSFGGDTAYDLELSETDEGYETILLTSSDTPLMSDSIDKLTEYEIDSLFDHVIETLRELEGN